MATFTSLQVASSFPVRMQEKGDFTIHGEYTLTATLASGDIIEMIKIPDGAWVKELVLNHTNLDPDGSSTLLKLNVGDGADRNRFAESHTANRVGSFRIASVDLNTATLNSIPYQYDLSDNDPNHYDTIDLQVIAYLTTGTAGGTIKLTATCTMDMP